MSRSPKRESDEASIPGPRTRTRVRAPDVGRERVWLVTFASAAGGPVASVATAAPASAAGGPVASVAGAGATLTLSGVGGPDVSVGAGAAGESVRVGEERKRLPAGWLAGVRGTASASALDPRALHSRFAGRTQQVAVMEPGRPAEELAGK